jgi:hypothetical protein
MQVELDHAYTGLRLRNGGTQNGPRYCAGI